MRGKHAGPSGLDGPCGCTQSVLSIRYKMFQSPLSVLETFPVGSNRIADLME